MARPTQGTGSPTLGRILPLGIALAVVTIACVAWAMRAAGLARSLALALAAGIVYGATAAVAKLTIAAFGGGGFVAGVAHWSTWTLVVLGPLGFLLNQNAFREGELASPAVAVITVTDPLVGIGIGTLWLREGLAAGPGAVTGEVLALAGMAAGVWFVAHRAPQLTGDSTDGAGERRGPVGTRPATT